MNGGGGGDQMKCYDFVNCMQGGAFTVNRHDTRLIESIDSTMLL